MELMKKIIVLFLVFSLNACVNVTKDIEYYPDYFSELYTCPDLEFANSVFIFNDGTLKIVSPGSAIGLTYKRKEKNIYYIYDGGALTQKILVFDEFYVMFQSNVNDSTMIQMTKDMFDPSEGNICFKRVY